VSEPVQTLLFWVDCAPGLHPGTHTVSNLREATPESIRAAGWMPEREHLAFIKDVREAQERNQTELNALMVEVRRLAQHFGVQAPEPSRDTSPAPREEGKQP